MKKQDFDEFKVIILGIIFDPKEKKILIGRRENDPHNPKLSWVFPGDNAKYEEDPDKTLKKAVKGETGLDVKNLGSIFAKTYSDKKEFLSVYFLCAIVGGKEKPGKNIKELKWVSPKEIEKYFTTPINPKLKEYLEEITNNR